MLSLIAVLAASTQPPTLRAELEPMRFLVGHCWRGPMNEGRLHDTHCFEPVFDGQHIRDRHEVTGGSKAYRGETIYSWDGGAGRVAYVYWNSLGGVSTGAMVPKPGMLDFGEDRYKGADGKTIVSATHWRIVDERTYEAVVTSAENPTGERLVRFTRVD